MRLILAAIAVCFAMPAAAQNANCNTPEMVAERLTTGYGERRVAVALGAGATLVETWANLTTGTWSITVTQAGGMTCLVASGQAFELVAEPQGVDG